MRDVEGGWLLRYMHANGASMFLIVVHLHIFRGLYHASYSSPREFVRCLGVVIFLLMIVTAFIGYVPPWGQMSFWGATVITSLASAIPVVGDTIVTWLWGGFSVDNATLNRFFSLHHLLPFLLVGASLLHLAALHQYGSNNPLGVHSEMDKIASYPYFYVKDLVGWARQMPILPLSTTSLFYILITLFSINDCHVKALSQEVKPARKSESEKVRFHHPKLPHLTKSSLCALSPRIETGLMLWSY
ncbi:unnamed protein product [Lactuca saligna]|uniref:Cytochrome b/b6 N-terminal region profile domain-containing protein n=1 Tax=Lactuca saligna TaxID=75948 RepID=A0AA36E5V9_LACSI|nr:unnamed protein product [Lactuca saligna]